MKRTAPLALALALALAVPAFAQESEERQPDYSRDSLIRILSVDARRPEQKIEHELGAIHFRALGMRWRYSYLPFLAPLQGSGFNHLTSKEWPDPFILTGTEIAMTARNYREVRARNAELRRIDRITRRAKVVVKP